MDAPILEGKKPVFASILRAGNGLLEGMLDLVPSARVAHIGIYRNPETLEPVEYYFKAPRISPTAWSSSSTRCWRPPTRRCAAIEKLKERGARDIRFVCLLAAPEGIERFQRVHPTCRSTPPRSTSTSTTTATSSPASATPATGSTGRSDRNVAGQPGPPLPSGRGIGSRKVFRATPILRHSGESRVPHCWTARISKTSQVRTSRTGYPLPAFAGITDGVGAHRLVHEGERAARLVPPSWRCQVVPRPVSCQPRHLARRPWFVWHRSPISTIRRATFIVASPGLVRAVIPCLKPTRLAPSSGARATVSGVDLGHSLPRYVQIAPHPHRRQRVYDYFSLPEAEKNGLADISRLPFSLRVLLENLLRSEDGRRSAPTISRPWPPG